MPENQILSQDEHRVISELYKWMFDPYAYTFTPPEAVRLGISNPAKCIAKHPMTAVPLFLLSGSLEGELSAVAVSIAATVLAGAGLIEERRVKWAEGRVYALGKGRALTVDTDEAGNLETVLRHQGSEDKILASWGTPQSTVCYILTTQGIQLARAIAGGDEETAPRQEWQAPSGFVGTKEICHDERFQKDGKNPPRTTIDAWRNKPGKAGAPQTHKAPDTGEVYLSEKWVQDQISHWNPRK